MLKKRYYLLIGAALTNGAATNAMETQLTTLLAGMQELKTDVKKILSYLEHEAGAAAAVAAQRSAAAETPAGVNRRLSGLIRRSERDATVFAGLKDELARAQAAGVDFNYSASNGRARDTLLWQALGTGLPEVQNQLISVGATLNAAEIDYLKDRDGVYLGKPLSAEIKAIVAGGGAGGAAGK